MSTPQNSVQPVIRTGTSPLLASGKTSAVQLSEEISGWIEGMSPSGASVYDTGPVTLTLAAGISGTATVRRVGKLVEVTFSTTGTFPVGLTTIVDAGGIPAALRPPSNRRGSAAVNGNPCMAYVSGAGLLGINQQTGVSRTGADGTVTYLLA